MPRRSWPPQLVPERIEEKKIIGRMVRKKNRWKNSTVIRQHAESWATLPQCTQHPHEHLLEKDAIQQFIIS